jgi:hypothetical protein
LPQNKTAYDHKLPGRSLPGSFCTAVGLQRVRYEIHDGYGRMMSAYTSRESGSFSELSFTMIIPALFFPGLPDK